MTGYLALNMVLQISFGAFPESLVALRTNLGEMELLNWLIQ